MLLLRFRSSMAQKPRGIEAEELFLGNASRKTSVYSRGSREARACVIKKKRFAAASSLRPTNPSFRELAEPQKSRTRPHLNPGRSPRPLGGWWT